MAIQSVDHIAEVSFRNHFLGAEEGAPVNGEIEVNDNTFNVTFNDGKVSAKFVSGNAFTNFFRSKTLSRFTQTLQAQYDVWLDEQRKIEEARIEELSKTLGFEDNPDAGKVAAVVNEFKAVLEATNPPGKKDFLGRLDQIATLAGLRNTLTRVGSGTECNEIVKNAGFLTHFDDNTKKLDAKGKKGYVLNMLDTIIGGFLQAASQMTDKSTQIVEFLRGFNGACVEAKSDNVQDWLARAAGIAKVSRSDQSHDLAYSVAAEFAVIAETVRAPYYDAAREACEAEVRAACAKKGITDEPTIQDRIEAKAAMIVLGKDDEIVPKIREQLEKYGKFALYETLVGANRPVTEIEKNAETGKWTVTTLVDNKGQPVLKPVSAFDIDRNFKKLVDMYLEDAVEMGMVEHETVKEEPVFASQEDLRAEGVLAEAGKYVSGEAEIAEFAKLVRKEFSYETDLSDEDFQKHVKQAIDEIATTKKDDPAETKDFFKRFVINHADGSYYDQRNDFARLVYLVTRRTETLIDNEKTCLAKLDEVSFRCAKMMQNAFKNQGLLVYAGSAKNYIFMALKSMIRQAFHGEAQDKIAQEAKSALRYLMMNGVLFTDNPIYDLGHRAAGRDEVKLHELFKLLMRCMQRFAGAKPNFYMNKANG